VSAKSGEVQIRPSAAYFPMPEERKRLRYSPGVRRRTRVKARDRTSALPKPQWSAISSILCVVRSKRRRAVSIRSSSRHSLARWIFFANQGEFRTGDYQEIMNKASCLSLVSNAILVWNTLQIARIVETLRQTDTPIADDDLAHVSPLLHRHVIPNGTYHFPPSYRGGRLVVETLPYVFTARRTPKGAFPSDYAPLYS
jgi:Tn3 transposase DDE domain